MVEEPAVLVVGEDQQGLGPHLRIGGERLEDPLRVEGTVGRQLVRVLGRVLGPHDPRHRGQVAAEDVAAELGDELAVGDGAAAAAVEVGGRVDVPLEEVEDVLLVVVPLPVHLPVDADLLQLLGVRRPAEVPRVQHALDVVDLGAALGPVGVDPRASSGRGGWGSSVPAPSRSSDHRS